MLFLFPPVSSVNLNHDLLCVNLFDQGETTASQRVKQTLSYQYTYVRFSYVLKPHLYVHTYIRPRVNVSFFLILECSTNLWRQDEELGSPTFDWRAEEVCVVKRYNYIYYILLYRYIFRETFQLVLVIICNPLPTPPTLYTTICQRFSPCYSVCIFMYTLHVGEPLPGRGSWYLAQLESIVVYGKRMKKGYGGGIVVVEGEQIR